MLEKKESKVIISIKDEGTAESEVYFATVGNLAEWVSKQPSYLNEVVQNVVLNVVNGNIERMSAPQLGVFINGYTTEEGDWAYGVYELSSVEIEEFENNF